MSYEYMGGLSYLAVAYLNENGMDRLRNISVTILCNIIALQILLVD